MDGMRTMIKSPGGLMKGERTICWGHKRVERNGNVDDV